MDFNERMMKKAEKVRKDAAKQRKAAQEVGNKEYPRYFGRSYNQEKGKVEKWEPGRYYFRLIPVFDEELDDTLSIIAQVGTHRNVTVPEGKAPSICPASTILTAGLPTLHQGKYAGVLTNAENEHSKKLGECPICDFANAVWDRHERAGSEEEKKDWRDVYASVKKKKDWWVWLAPWEKGSKECDSPVELYQISAQVMKGLVNILTYKHDGSDPPAVAYAKEMYPDVFDNENVPQETKDKFLDEIKDINLGASLTDLVDGLPIEVTLRWDPEHKDRYKYSVRLYFNHGVTVPVTNYESERFGHVKSFREIFNEIYRPQYYTVDQLLENLLAYKRYKGLLTAEDMSKGVSSSEPVPAIAGQEDVPFGGGEADEEDLEDLKVEGESEEDLTMDNEEEEYLDDLINDI